MNVELLQLIELLGYSPINGVSLNCVPDAAAAALVPSAYV
jgi:hypothetical protein